MSDDDPVLVLSPQVTGRRFLEADTDRGVTELFRPADDVVVLRMLGHLSLGTARMITDALERELDGQAFHLFAEWSALLTYEPSARKHITSWVLERRDEILPSFFCAGNRMVEMGISVGAMAVSLVGVEASVVPADVWMANLRSLLEPG